MSGTQDHEQHEEASHEGPIKTPKQLIWAVFFAFAVPIVIIVMLATLVGTEVQPSAGSDALAAKAVDARISPVSYAEVKDQSDPSTMKTGEQVFQAQCSTCHAVGALGSPKFGDAAAWGPRIAKGFAELLVSALHGKGNMPAQGGGDYTDLEVARALVYMADHGGAKFPEPALPLPGTAASTASK